jgi:hypothetical protein
VYKLMSKPIFYNVSLTGPLSPSRFNSLFTSPKAEQIGSVVIISASRCNLPHK